MGTDFGMWVLLHWSVRQLGFCPVLLFCFCVMLPLMVIYGLFLLTIMPKKQKDDAPAVFLIQLTLLTAAVLVVSRRGVQPGCVPECGRRGGSLLLLLIVLALLIEQRSRIRLPPENTFRRGMPRCISPFLCWLPG